jgi:hypothetical protein
MTAIAKHVREVAAVGGRLPDEMLRATQPYVVRGLAADWPLVRAGRASAQAADAYLRGFYRDATVNAMLGPPDIQGRFFYNDDITGFNFHNVRARLDQVLDELAAHRERPDPGAIYVGSTSIDGALPGLRAQNDVDLGGRDALASIWVGNRTVVATHYDLPDNLAVVAVGERRFTLFPPDQLRNLYVGPLDFNPAGQAISLVDVRVEALSDFNVLVNYWWRQSPDWMDTPTNALMLAILTMRELPPEQRRAWQEIFRHYIFEPDPANLAHLPENARYALSPLSEDGARVLRGQLLRRINR